MWARVTDTDRATETVTERHKTTIKREKEPQAGGGGKINKTQRNNENEKLRYFLCYINLWKTEEATETLYRKHERNTEQYVILNIT